MRCPKCGAEATEQSVYCHKCGERIDLPQQPSEPVDQAAAGPAPEEPSSGGGPIEEASRPAPSPAERFKDLAATRQGQEDEPEEELWRGGYSSKAMIGAWGLSALITLVLLVIWIWQIRSGTWWIVLAIVVALLWIYQFSALKYRQWNVRYLLTSQRFIHETGILRRVTDRIEVIDMDDITFEQSLLERFVGVGTVRITSSDSTHPQLDLRGIANVKEVAGKIDDTRRIERRRRGLHIEAI